MTFSQADLARAVQMSQMSINRLAHAIGDLRDPMDEPDAILILTAGMLFKKGLAFSRAAQIVSRFRDDVLHVAVEPETRNRWVVFVGDAGRANLVTSTKPVTISAVSPTHLSNVSSHPLARTLSLVELIRQAVGLVEELKSRKPWNAA